MYKSVRGYVHVCVCVCVHTPLYHFQVISGLVSLIHEDLEWCQF